MFEKVCLRGFENHRKVKTVKGEKKKKKEQKLEEIQSEAARWALTDHQKY